MTLHLIVLSSGRRHNLGQLIGRFCHTGIDRSVCLALRGHVCTIDRLDDGVSGTRRARLQGRRRRRCRHAGQGDDGGQLGNLDGRRLFRCCRRRRQGSEALGDRSTDALEKGLASMERGRRDRAQGKKKEQSHSVCELYKTEEEPSM